MKKLIAIATVGACVSLQAGTTILTPLTDYTGTNNTTATAVGTQLVDRKALFIQNNGLVSTNVLTVKYQLSLDNTNFFDAGVYIPTSTNAATDTMITAATNVTIYARVQIITTNTTAVGVAIQQ